MRKLVAFLIICLLFAFGSCKKNSSSCGIPDASIIASDFEIQNLTDSLNKYGIINALQHKSGFFYIIKDNGSTVKATDLCSTVIINYRGGFFNGVGFDSTKTTPASFTLGQTIPGFIDAVRLIGKGGSIEAFIPPSLGYGNKTIEDNKGNVIIPANSYLVFDIKLVDVK